MTTGAAAAGVGGGGTGATGGAGTADGGGRRLLAIGAGLLAVLLLAGVGAAIFLGGGPPGPTQQALVSPSPLESPAPTLVAVVSLDPASTGLATSTPIALVTPGTATTPPTIGPVGTPVVPTQRPTRRPRPTPSPTPEPTPEPTPANCRHMTAATRWFTFSTAETTWTIRPDRIWCVHQIVFVADSGIGQLKLWLTNDAFVPDYGMDRIGWYEANMPGDFPSSSEYVPDPNIQPYPLLQQNTKIDFTVTCDPSTPDCSGFVQIGTEIRHAPELP